MIVIKPLVSREVFISGNNVVLKVLTKYDVFNSKWYGWFNDEQLSKTLQKHYFPNTIENQMQFWKNEIAKSTNKFQVGICKKVSNIIIGVCSLTKLIIYRKTNFRLLSARKMTKHKNSIESCKFLFTQELDVLYMIKILR